MRRWPVKKPTPRESDSYTGSGMTQLSLLVLRDHEGTCRRVQMSGVILRAGGTETFWRASGVSRMVLLGFAAEPGG